MAVSPGGGVSTNINCPTKNLSFPRAGSRQHSLNHARFPLSLKAEQQIDYSDITCGIEGARSLTVSIVDYITTCGKEISRQG